jgi:hypothetical protein
MSRNKRYFGSTPTPSALGDSHLGTAIDIIDGLCQRTVAVMTEYSVSRDDTIRALFPPDVLERAMAARDLIEPNTHTIGYHIGSISTVFELSIKYWEPRHYPPLNASAMVLQPTSAPLLAFIEEVRAIHEQFEELKAVLRWLNRNATPGAIRYYFPAVLALCPNSPPIMALQHVPTRYTQPKDINDWMQSIRDASAVYAGTQMLPSTAKGRDRGDMWLTFRSRELQRGNVSFVSDSRVYNI